MKKLLLVPIFLLFGGCVSYYTPVNAIEDGVYYAEDDPEYNNNAYVYNYGSYYPWASIDYFYFGGSPYYPAYRYPTYRYGFGGYVGAGFSIGFSTYYDPWAAPYYGYYRSYGMYSPYYNYGYPRYAYGYGYNFGGYGYGGCRYGYCSGKGHKGDRYADNNRDNRNRNRNGNNRDNQGDRNRGGRNGGNNEGSYAGNNRGYNNYRSPDNGEDYGRQPNDKGINRRNTGNSGSVETRTNRYVSTSPDSQAGTQGMVVRNRGDAKQPRKSRTHRSTEPQITTQSQPSRSYQIRNQQQADKGRSRTMPIDRQQRQRVQRQADLSQQRQVQARSGSVTGRNSTNDRSAAAQVTRAPDGQARMKTQRAQPQRTQPQRSQVQRSQVQRSNSQSRSRSTRSSSRTTSMSRSSSKSRSRHKD